ncbi:hypothetical protein [Virgibacillus halodenitrificans]|nr:hypothetical protein [Virgibacillus halodenitrificans]
MTRYHNKPQTVVNLAMFQQEIDTIQAKQSQHITKYNEIKHKK